MKVIKAALSSQPLVLEKLTVTSLNYLGTEIWRRTGACHVWEVGEAPAATAPAHPQEAWPEGRASGWGWHCLGKGPLPQLHPPDTHTPTSQATSACAHVPSPCLLEDVAPVSTHALPSITSPHLSWAILTLLHTCCCFSRRDPTFFSYPKRATAHVSALFKGKFPKRLGFPSLPPFLTLSFSDSLYLLSANVSKRSIKISKYYCGFVDFF